MDIRYILKKLSTTDGEEIYGMLQQIPANENGFENKFKSLGFKEYRNQLKLYDENSRGINLPESYVPQTTYWFYVDDKPVGLIKIRHRLTELLREHGGHIGYSIIGSERGKGYGTVMLRLALKEAAKLSISEVLVTCDVSNIASQRITEKNGGILNRETEKSKYYLISTQTL